MTTTSAMFQGRLEGIYLAEMKRETLQRLEEVMAIAGRGLEGDRYCRQQGTFSKAGHADREVTLIEIEALEALAHECAINLEPGQARRNLVTRGVPLNHLVGKEFQVGGVVLRGLRLCEPCGHLEGLTIKGVKDGLCHRGGLRAQIVRGGVVKTGDAIALYQETEHSAGLVSTANP
ncbi:MAG TPA: MOSC domain-containing protein [Gemmataceae bacterium]|nr:MOSC domain-containing protein [Gemmataceae bacterium]